MSEFNKAVAGGSLPRNVFKLRDRKIADVAFGDIVPLFARFAIPGDVWKIQSDLLIRLQPMLSPCLTPIYFDMRYFFVPLRLLDENTEKIITGSSEGHLLSSEYSFPSLFNVYGYKKVDKHSVCDYMLGMPVGDYSSFKDEDFLPASYWIDAYYRIWFDYYRDENLATYSNFNEFLGLKRRDGHLGLDNSLLRKTYYTCSLPWQLKSQVAPAIDFVSSSNAVFDFSQYANNPITASSQFISSPVVTYESSGVSLKGFHPERVLSQSDASSAQQEAMVNAYNDFLTSSNTIPIITGGLTMAQLREMSAITRIYERLARCGSRYTEYLTSNFGIAPADGTLQRAQYLGGFSGQILTTEVVQTADASVGNDKTPVGTLRGHGISRGSSRIGNFYCKEFGVIIGCLTIRPEIQFIQGINREYTYKNRFDFYNPSFQGLSEQQVRNGEIYVDFSDGKNDKGFGYVPYASELRSGKNMLVGDMRGSLLYWSCPTVFNSRPNLNVQFLNAKKPSYLSPFAVQGNAYPFIVDFGTVSKVARCMQRNPIPGLIDHF